MKWFTAAFTREGRGIDRNAPPKTGFALLADVLARNWWELVQLNLLMLLFSLPLVTLPAALVAGARVCALMLEDRPIYLGRDFLEAFRSRFRAATLLGLGATAAILLPAWSALIFLEAARANILLALPLTVSASVALFAAIASAHGLVLVAQGERQVLRRALLFALLKPLPVLAALGVVALFWALHVLLYPASIFMPVLINFSFGTLAVTFGVDQAAVRQPASEGAAGGRSCAGGSAQSAR